MEARSGTVPRWAMKKTLKPELNCRLQTKVTSKVAHRTQSRIKKSTLRFAFGCSFSSDVAQCLTLAAGYKWVRSFRSVRISMVSSRWWSTYALTLTWHYTFFSTFQAFGSSTSLVLGGVFSQEFFSLRLDAGSDALLIPALHGYWLVKSLWPWDRYISTIHLL